MARRSKSGRDGAGAGVSLMWRLAAPLALGAAALTAVPAQAQFSDSYNFLKAVRDRAKPESTQKAIQLIRRPGSTLVDARDYGSGDTALHIVVRDRDLMWIRFLLEEGASPDMANNAGETPLMAAVYARSTDAARLLLAKGAQIDKDNRQGETALIRAVHIGDLAMVRLLMANGANPDKRDSLAGMSARDYAKRDSRAPGMMEALSATAPARKASGEVQGPRL